MKIIEYEDKYLEDVKDLLVELEEYIVSIDKDAFDLSNLNRQTLESIADLGLDKSAVAAEKVRLINPYVKVTTFNEHADQTNIDKIIGDSDIVIDALDNVLTRVIVSRKAKEKGDEGEWRVHRAIEKVSHGRGRLLNDVVLKDKDGKSYQIDHIST